MRRLHPTDEDLSEGTPAPAVGQPLALRSLGGLWYPTHPQKTRMGTGLSGQRL
jgi:hypothetical protein